MRHGILTARAAHQATTKAARSPLGLPPATLGFTATACKDDYSFLPNRVECGDMRVEETRGSGNGRTVVFPMVIVRASAARKQPDPVIFLHGGPGGGIIGALPMPVSRELRQMLALCAAEPSPAGARSAAAPAFGPLRSRR